MKKIYLGLFGAIRYIGEIEKEFTRAPFSPKPIVKNGDIIVMEKIHAYNTSKLLPEDWELINSNVIELDEEDELLEIIEDFKSEVEELAAVVADYDLKAAQNEENQVNTTNEALKEVLDKSNDTNESLDTTTIAKPLSDFNSKEELELYILEEFGLELDESLSLEDMYKLFIDIVTKQKAEEK